MFKKKKISILVIAIIIIAIFVYAYQLFIELFEINTINDFNLLWQSLTTSNEGKLALLIYILALMVSLLFNPITLIIVCVQIFKFFYNLSEKKHKVHPKFDIQYFRDDLSEVSPSLASFLINLELELDRDIPAHILKLLLDGYVQEENDCFIVTNKDQSLLPYLDQLILKFVSSNFENNSFLAEYKNAVIDYAINNDLVVRNRKGRFLIFLFLAPIFSSILMFTIIPIMGIIFEKYLYLAIALMVFMMILVLILSFGVPIGIITYVFMYAKKGSFRRTQKGNNLLEQIMGLKNYLTDFSNLDQSTLKDLILREYYLVYAVVLGVNNQVDDEILLKIQNQIKKSSVY